VTPDAKTARLAAAIENNVDWCDRVCRVNGLTPQRTATAWTSAVRTPKLYPDAISLSVETTADEILEVIDLSEGCSVKDSFATLDVHTYGFSILLRPPGLSIQPQTSAMGTSTRFPHCRGRPFFDPGPTSDLDQVAPQQFSSWLLVTPRTSAARLRADRSCSRAQ
jgi:hypothetical protein